MSRWQWRASGLFGLLLLAALTGCGGGSSPLEVDRSETALARPQPVSITPPEPAVASAVLQVAEESELRGLASFLQEDEGIRVVVEVSDAEPGTYAMWIHEQGHCLAPEFETSGAAFDPAQEGAQGEQAAGDLGALEVSADGRGRRELLSRRLTVADGLHAVEGRSVLLHRVSAAGVLACGVIQLQVEEESDEAGLGSE